MATQKFRPVLTAEQIDYILTCVDADSDLGLSIHKQLVPFKAKIEIKAVAPSYIVTPESEKIKIDRELRARYNDGLMSAEEEAEYEAKIMGI